MSTNNNDDTVVMTRGQRIRARLSSPRWRPTVIIVGIIVLALALMGLGAFLNDASYEDTAKADVNTAATAAKHKVVVDVAKQGLEQVGHNESDLTFDEFVDNTNDPGTGVYGEEIRTPADAVEFLDSDTPQARAALKAAIQQTSEDDAKTTKTQLLDEDNWVAVQFNESVVWEGNTYYYNGPQRADREKVDNKSSIALIFVPPAQVERGEVTSLFALRGACANPQYRLPIPYKVWEKKHHDRDHKCTHNCGGGGHDCKSDEHVGYDGRCVKKQDQHDSTSSGGGSDIPTHDKVSSHKQEPTKDAEKSEPPKKDRSDDSDHGNSGNDGAEAEGESDESHSDDETEKDNEPSKPDGW